MPDYAPPSANSNASRIRVVGATILALQRGADAAVQKNYYFFQKKFLVRLPVQFVQSWQIRNSKNDVAGKALNTFPECIYASPSAVDWLFRRYAYFEGTGCEPVRGELRSTVSALKQERTPRYYLTQMPWDVE